LNYLIDTHLLLWAAGARNKLSKRALQLLEDPTSQLWFSAASMWELAVKQSLGRADFHVELRRLWRGLLDNGWHELAIRSEHSIALLKLPSIHKDPFDRMLIAQAEVEGLTLLTSDHVVARYAGSIRRV
jgi:PIN domain nuclease of toxin-antitoxin system